MDDRNWNRIAQRHNAAVEIKAPLLASAGLITRLTAEQIRASYERWNARAKNSGYGKCVLPSVAGVWFRGRFRNQNWTVWTRAALDYRRRASMKRTSGVPFSPASVGTQFSSRGCSLRNQEQGLCSCMASSARAVLTDRVRVRSSSSKDAHCIAGLAGTRKATHLGAMNGAVT